MQLTLRKIDTHTDTKKKYRAYRGKQVLSEKDQMKNTDNPIARKSTFPRKKSQKKIYNVTSPWRKDSFPSST